MFDARKGWNTSFTQLVWGTLLSVGLLLGMYVLAADAVVTGWTLAIAVLLLATAQGVIQTVLFLHVGVEAQPKWSLLVFLFMLMVIFILVGGSLWIMANINYNAM